jgi:hypothetical protein
MIKCAWNIRGMYTRENISQYHFVHHKSYTDWLRLRSERSATDHLMAWHFSCVGTVLKLTMHPRFRRNISLHMQGRINEAAYSSKQPPTQSSLRDASMSKQDKYTQRKLKISIYIVYRMDNLNGICKIYWYWFPRWSMLMDGQENIQTWCSITRSLYALVANNV